MLGLYSYGISEQRKEILDRIDEGCLYFFAAEVSLKVLAFGPVKFWKDTWNIFDFMLVVCSVASLVLDNLLQDTVG